MENNIFEGAKFGDKFLTRDGRIVRFYYKDKQNAYAKFVMFINNEPQDFICLLPNGNYCLHESPNDIVSRYKEPINEKKLNELAYDLSNKESTKWWEEVMNKWKSLPKEEQKKYHQLIGFNDFADTLLNKMAEAYIAGYRKALENGYNSNNKTNR